MPSGLKAELIQAFRAPEALEFRIRALQRRVMQPGESIHDYYYAVLEMYDVLKALGKSYSPQEIATKLVEGTPQPYYKDLAIMDPQTPNNSS